jgi:hypothetical protein
VELHRWLSSVQYVGTQVGQPFQGGEALAYSVAFRRIDYGPYISECQVLYQERPITETRNTLTQTADARAEIPSTAVIAAYLNTR